MAQDQLHFLLTSTTSIRITDPVCKEMAEKSKEQLINQIDEISKNQKKEGIKVEKMGLSQQAYFELLQQFKSNPDQLFPAFPITTIIIK
jgi:YHS domain-containing protein